jgi:hypothetical protein
MRGGRNSLERGGLAPLSPLPPMNSSRKDYCDASLGQSGVKPPHSKELCASQSAQLAELLANDYNACL